MPVENKIKELRTSRNIPQLEMAKALQVSRQTINAIENKKYNPSLELSMKIAAYFELPMEEIFELRE